MSLKVAHKDLIGMFQSMGFPAADKWPVVKLEKSVKRLVNSDPDEPPEFSEPAAKATFDKVMDALKADDDVEITGLPKATSKAQALKAKPTKTGTGGSKAKGIPHRADANGKPGVVMSIVEFLEKANEAKPISKPQVLEKLKARFPNRAESSMARTVNAQIGYHLNKFKGYIIKRNDRGYWISGKAKSDTGKKTGKKKAAAAAAE
jgi:hypothetical protein